MSVEIFIWSATIIFCVSFVGIYLDKRFGLADWWPFIPAIGTFVLAYNLPVLSFFTLFFAICLLGIFGLHLNKGKQLTLHAFVTDIIPIALKLSLAIVAFSLASGFILSMLDFGGGSDLCSRATPGGC